MTLLSGTVEEAKNVHIMLHTADDGFLAIDPFRSLNGFAVEVRSDNRCCGTLHRDAFDRHGERGSEVFAEDRQLLQAVSFEKHPDSIRRHSRQ